MMNSTQLVLNALIIKCNQSLIKNGYKVEYNTLVVDKATKVYDQVSDFRKFVENAGINIEKRHTVNKLNNYQYICVDKSISVNLIFDVVKRGGLNIYTVTDVIFKNV